MDKDIFDHNGVPGATMRRFNRSANGLEQLSEGHIPDVHFSAMMENCDVLHIDTVYRPSIPGDHYLEFISTGPAKLLIDDVEYMTVKDKRADQMAFILGSANGKVQQHRFEAGREYRIHIETSSPEVRPDRFALLEGVIGITLGHMLQDVYEEDLLPEAVEVAKTVDTAIVFVGRSKPWESEGCDHESMALPARGSQDRLIEAVAEVNSNTIVVNSTGTPINMPWLSKVKAVLHTWFPGQEAGNSIADVVFGKTCPGGRLPCTFPVSESDAPAHGNFPGDVDNTLQVKYEEGSFIGHRYFYHHPDKVLFQFGYGLSYTQFDIFDIESKDIEMAGDHYSVTARVRNTGNMTGAEVLQVYVVPVDQDDSPVQRKLAAYCSVDVAPGNVESVEMSWTHEQFAEWDEQQYQWVIAPGRYVAQVATTAAAGDVKASFAFRIDTAVHIRP